MIADLTFGPATPAERDGSGQADPLGHSAPQRRSRTSLVGSLPLIQRLALEICGAGATTFMFHRVLPEGMESYEPELVVSENAFIEFLDWLETSYRVLPLEELIARRTKPRDRHRPDCALTFDDGWLDIFHHAFPHLQRRNIPATIFLPVRYIGTERRFWQERLWFCLRSLGDRASDLRWGEVARTARSFPWFPPCQSWHQSYYSLRRVLMTRPREEAEEFVRRLEEMTGMRTTPRGRAFLDWNEIRRMSGHGITFGSHTLDHTLLTNATPRQAETEIDGSRAELAGQLRSAVHGFSYPWGACTPTNRDQVREAGYGFAVTTRAGLVQAQSDPWLLPRLAVSDSLLRSGVRRFAPQKARISWANSILFPSKRPAARPKSAGERTKILFVIDQITEWEGGTERQLRALIRSLDSRFFDPELCFLLPSPRLPSSSYPCPTHWLCPGKSAGILPVRLFRLLRFLRQKRPDIVQCFFPEGIIAGILVGRLAGVPRVVGSGRNAGYFKTIRYRAAFRLVTPLAHVWQCNSKFLWEYANQAEKIAPERIEILPNGLDLSKLVGAAPAEKLALRQQLGLTPQGPVFVSVANLAQVKNLSTLVEAAGLLRDRLPDAEYVLVGEGPEREMLERRAARLGVSQSVKFVGRQPDVRPYLAAADVGILTSLSEGSSNSLLEYMAMGLPSVVSDIPANRELVSGVLFKAGDPADLADKIKSLCNGAEFRRELSCRYREAAEEFGLEKFSLRTQSFYSRLAAEIS